MKKFIIIISFAVSLIAYGQQEIAPDSTPNTLDEVVVTADSQIETSKKVIIRPTTLDKKHSTNAYTLLENLNPADLNINATAQTVSTVTGRSVVILINGVEVQPDEVGTLSASEIVQIDYQRNPGGKYVGNGAVLNILTRQYDYGGNVYVSADEGLARQFGEYVGMVNFKRKAATYTLTASDKWSHQSELKSSENLFNLNSGVLNQSIRPIEGKTRLNSQYLNFKFAHAVDNHSFDVSWSLTRSNTPINNTKSEVLYSGLYNFNSTVSRTAKEKALSPSVKLNYNLYLPGGQTFMVSAAFRHGHTNFNSIYSETGFEDIINNTVENNIITNATLGYFKTFANNLSLGASVDDYFNNYHDAYTGSFNNKQTLTNNHLMAIMHLDQTLPVGLSYYTSFGLTDLYSTIGSHRDNQMSPMAFYGVNYSINQKNTVSLTGNYLHSIYNPSFKSDTEIRTSFFEATLGNPDLKQLKSFQNMISYNGRIKGFGLSFTYDFLKYFGNTSNRYFAENDIMFHQLVNDGTFHYHKLIFSATANLLHNTLRLKANALFNANRFNSEYRPAASNNWRYDFSVSYMFGDWQLRGAYASSYSNVGIEGIRHLHPAQYGLYLSWQRGKWAVECCAENFLSRRACSRTDANYGDYKSLSRNYTDLKGRNISLSVTYILGYGKKTDRDKVETESSINSAILRPF